MSDNSIRVEKLRSTLGVVAVSLVLAGCGGGDPPPDTTVSGKTGSPTVSGGGPSGPATTGLPGTTAVASAAPPKNTMPPPGTRPDPFKPYWNTVPPPPPVSSFLTPVRIADTNTTAPKEEPGIDIRVVPTRRVAGILTGNGVYALLDDSGKQTVVRPGMKLDDGYEVVMINSNSVVLRKKEGSQTFTEIVPLTDAGSAPSSGGGMSGGTGGMRSGKGMIGGPAGGGLSGPGGMRGGGFGMGNGGKE